MIDGEEQGNGVEDPSKLLKIANQMIYKTRGAFLDDGVIEMFFGFGMLFYSLKIYSESWFHIPDELYGMVVFGLLMLMSIFIIAWYIHKAKKRGNYTGTPLLPLAGMYGVFLIIGSKIDFTYTVPLVNLFYLGIIYYFTRVPRFIPYMIWAVISFFAAMRIDQVNYQSDCCPGWCCLTELGIMLFSPALIVGGMIAFTIFKNQDFMRNEVPESN